MPRVFDPARKRDLLLTSTLPRLRTLADARDAASAVSAACYAFIVGLDGEGRELAARAAAVLAADSELSPARRRAQKDEPVDYWLHGREGMRLTSLALARWLATGSADPATMAAAADQYERMFAADKARSSRADSEDLNAYMTAALQGADAEHVLAFYLAEDRDAAKPLEIRRAKSPRRVAEAILRHRTRGEFSGADVVSAIDGVLRKMIPEWLAGGLADRAAHWLKIRFADIGREAQPESILRHASDYLRA